MSTNQPKASARPAVDDDSLLAGEIIADKYRLVSRLGQGGMASVWLATNVVLDVAVALKLIRTDIDSPEASARLLREARAVARLGHPAIVRIFDFGQTRRGAPFIAMELLKGITLANAIDSEGAMPAVRAVQTLLPVADGLAAAHAKGIVHRDLKPDNIFLARDEAGRLQPKVVDFGIAKLDGSQPHAEESTTQALDLAAPRARGRITVDGKLLGSPDYMAPEQAIGSDEVDHRADIWAFCVVLYEMIADRTPFEGSTYGALLKAISNEPPVSLVDLGFGDRDLWVILENGLRKQPDDRWQTMRELGEALALWLYERGIKEDVCASSLHSSWLQSGLSDVRIVVPPTLPPPPGSRPSGELSQGRSSFAPPRASAAPPIVDEHTLVGMTGGPDARRRGAMRTALIAGTLAAIGLAALAFLSTRGADDPSAEIRGPASSAASQPPETTIPADVPTPGNAGAAPPTSAAASPASAASKPERAGRPPAARPTTKKEGRGKGNGIDLGF